MKDKSNSGRPSTSSTEVNVEWVKQVVSGNRRLTIWMIASQLDMKKKTMFGRLSPKIWPWGKSAQKDYWIMIRRSAACCYVRISSSVFKLNKTCFVESSLVMRHGLFLSTTWKPIVKAISGSLRYCRGRRKQESHIDHILRWEGHRPQRALATESDNKLVRRSKTHGMLNAREETRVVTRQIVTALPRQCTFSQCPEHAAIPWREENHRTGTTSQFTWFYSLWLFSFLKAQGDPFLKAWRSSRGP